MAEPIEIGLGRIHAGDCVDVLATLPAESVDLVLADPPFNIGKDYGPHSDVRGTRDYLAWTARWLAACARVLKPGGALFVYNLPRWNTHAAVILEAAGLTFRHWIAVELTTGLVVPYKLIPAHYSLLYFTKGRPRAFSRPRVPLATCRHCGRELRDYGGRRKFLHPDGANLKDVWTDIRPAYRGTPGWRANSLPPALVDRVLTIASRPGDLVLDPFAGSGTVAEACERSARRWLAIDIHSADVVARRMRAVLADGFAPVHTGPHDRTTATPRRHVSRAPRFACRPNRPL